MSDRTIKVVGGKRNAELRAIDRQAEKIITILKRWTSPGYIESLSEENQVHCIKLMTWANKVMEKERLRREKEDARRGSIIKRVK